MPPSRLLLSTCVFALLVAGCDRQSAPPAQPQETASAQPAEQLSGKLDRSFAGTAIPAVTVTDPEGAQLELADLAGKPALLNLWATWCAPCVVEMPMLDALAAEMGDEVAIVTVSEDLTGAEAVKPFFEQRGFKNLPQWLDPDNGLVMSFGGDASLPLTVLYDAQGKEIWRVKGGYDWASPEARQQIAEALKET